MLTAEQRAVRLTGIGASEVAKLCDVHPWGGAIDVWLEKPTPSRAPLCGPSEESENIQIGDVLEGALVGLLSERADVALYRQKTTYRHPTRPHVLASPDALTRGKRNRRGGEIKVVGVRVAHHWEDGLPDYVRTQAAQNMAVLDVNVWHVGALIGGTRFETFTVERDADIEASLLDMVESWWSDHIDGDTPPPFANTDEKWRYLRARYPGSTATKCRAEDGDDVNAAVARIREIDAMAGALADEMAGLRNVLCHLIGDDYGIEGQYGKALWYPMSGRVNWKAIAEELAGGVVREELIEKHRGEKSRTFRLCEPKKDRRR